MTKLYQEHQSQRRPIAWLVAGGIWFLSVRRIYELGLSSEHPIFDALILIGLPLLVTGMLLVLRLSILITKHNFMYRLIPFHWKYRAVPLDQITSIEVKEYNTGRAFHGWGLGLSWDGRRRYYTVSGHRALELRLENGTELFVGTVDPQAIKSLIDSLRNKRFASARRNDLNTPEMN